MRTPTSEDRKRSDSEAYLNTITLPHSFLHKLESVYHGLKVLGKSYSCYRTVTRARSLNKRGLRL